MLDAIKDLQHFVKPLLGDGTESEKDHSQEAGLAGDVTYIGNINSKKLHTEYCANLPKEENRVCFNSLSEALDAGYELCQSCN